MAEFNLLICAFRIRKGNSIEKADFLSTLNKVSVKNQRQDLIKSQSVTLKFRGAFKKGFQQSKDVTLERHNEYSFNSDTRSVIMN